MTTDLLEVALLPGKGRGYRATNDIAVGTVVHISDPYATTVSQEWIPETCMWCFNFSYPKKQKVKVISEEEQVELLKEWEVFSDKNKHSKQMKKHKFLFKNMVFCSEACKMQFKTDSPYWKNVLAMNYQLELEYENSIDTEENIVNEVMDANQLGNDQKWISINDDTALSQWLDEAWDCLTKDLDLYKEIDDNDRAMCRLIGSCILRKNNEKEQDSLKFDDVLVIQNNESTHFKTYFTVNTLYPDHPQELPNIFQLESDAKKQIISTLLPTEVLDIMAVYSYFARAVTTRNNNAIVMPVLSGFSHALFRSVFFRERANSFGLWEMSSTGENGVNDGVSDDLELLGWGIYPSAVYFNHSCDANVVKIRDGRRMKFIARRMIEKGEEACISYGNVGEELDARRSRLLEHYHFLCQCTRCVHEDKLRIMTR